MTAWAHVGIVAGALWVSMVVHELGHVIGSGGSVSSVVLGRPGVLRFGRVTLGPWPSGWVVTRRTGPVFYAAGPGASVLAAWAVWAHVPGAQVGVADLVALGRHFVAAARGVEVSAGLPISLAGLFAAMSALFGLAQLLPIGSSDGARLLR